MVDVNVNISYLIALKIFLPQEFNHYLYIGALIKF